MKSILFTITFICSILSANAQEKVDILHELTVDVVYLASDYLEGRETGTIGEERAADYIARRFKEIGLAPKGDDNSYFHHFDFKHNANPHEKAEKGEERTGKNVVAYIDNGAANTVIVGGHYDHLGKGTFGSRHTGEEAIHNGADDNASGIAALLYIAEFVKKSELKSNNYLFIAFSGEEMGLIGSKKFTQNPTIDLTKVNYMLNMDMVGCLKEEKVLSVNGVGTSPSWNKIVEKIDIGGIKPKTTESGVGPSDHTSFYLKDIPVLHFFTGQHEHYHKPTDDVSIINFDGIYNVANFLILIIEKLDKEPRLTFTKTKDESEGRKAAAFKVTLGVMPDYVYEGEGMHIDSVIEGRPAHKAGLENGDVVVKIGEVEVKDIYDYMEGLGKLKTGDKAEVIVLRKGKKITKEVQF